MPPAPAASTSLKLFRHRIHPLVKDVDLGDGIVVDSITASVGREVVVEDDGQELTILEDPEHNDMPRALKAKLLGGSRLAISDKKLITTPTGVLLIRKSDTGKYTATRPNSIAAIASRGGIPADKAADRWIE